jgi:DNA polymerase III psi subunit
MSPEQFKKLNVMGIALWQYKLTDECPNNATTDGDSTVHLETIKTDDLKQSQLFNDCLRAIGLNFTDIQIKTDHINLGWVNWYFSTEETISYNQEQAKLITPVLTQLTEPKLKRALWKQFISLKHND